MARAALRSPRLGGLPLAVRLIAISFLLLAAVLLMVAGLTIRLTRDHLHRDLDRRVLAVVESFQEGPATRVNEPGQLARQVRQWLSEQGFPDDEVVAVRTRGGDVLTSTGGVDLRAVEGANELLTARESSWHDVNGPDGRLRVLTVPVVLAGREAGTLVVAAERDRVDDTLDTLLGSVALASGVGLILATVFAFVSIRRTLRPLSRMASGVDEIEASRDHGRRLDHEGPADEVGRLADSFNRMLASLEDAYRSHQRFLSDASHELRTPLTVARGRLELLAQELRDAEAQSALSVAIDEIDRMGHIVEDLLLLARLDEGLPLARGPVEVELVLEEASLRATMVSDREVRVEPEAGLFANADHERLLQVVTNLVSNAVHHAGYDAAVSLRSHRANGQVLLDVSDTGAGIPPDELPHVFERFYRGSRRDGGAGGAGLGLAIAASLVRAMDGEISVRSEPGDGTTFTVSLPAASVPS